jgi:hypothetical protein
MRAGIVHRLAIAPLMSRYITSMLPTKGAADGYRAPALVAGVQGDLSSIFPYSGEGGAKCDPKCNLRIAGVPMLPRVYRLVGDAFGATSLKYRS